MDLSLFDLVPNRIFVGGLPFTANEKDLRDYFNQFPNCVVSEVRIIFDPKTNASKGYGFVTFENEKETAKLIAEKSDSISFHNQVLKISQAYKRKLTANSFNMHNNHNSYSYNSKSKSSNQQVTVQIDDLKKCEGYLLSPTSGKVLNVMTPVSPAAECQSIEKQDNSKPEVKTTTAVVTENTDENEEKNNAATKASDVAEIVIEVTEPPKEDNNNNIIVAKLIDTKNVELTKPVSSVVEDSRKANTHSSYTNHKLRTVQGNQRNNVYNNNRPNTYNSRYQANGNTSYKHPQNVNTSNHPAQPNSAGKQYAYNPMMKTPNQEGINQHQSQMQLFYNMAAFNSMNMHSPMAHQQSSMLHASAKTQHGPLKNRSNINNSSNDLGKSSNVYAGSIMNINQPSHMRPNVHEPSPSIHPQQFQQQQIQHPVTNNYDGQKTNVSSAQYGFQAQPKRPQQQSSNSNSYVPSVTSSYSSSSSSSSACSSTPSTQPNANKSQPAARPATNAQANNAAAAAIYANHSASLNSAAAVSLPPLLNHSNNNVIPANQVCYDQYQNGGIPVYAQQQQYGTYPNVYYYPPNVNSYPSNTPPNDTSTNTTTTSSTVSSTTPGPLTPKSQYSTGQSLYYPTTSVSANSIAPSAPSLTPTEILPPQQNGYTQMQGTNNCTITNAFETATNSGSACTEAQASFAQSKSAEPLDEIFRKQLSLSADYGQQQLMYTYYAPQQTGYQQTPTFNNGNMGAPVPPQYYYYYAPILEMPPNTPHQPTFDQTQQPINGTFQPVPILINQQLPPPPPSTVFHPNPVPNPIHVNTMISSGQMPSFQPNSAPIASSAGSYYAPSAYPEHQQQAYQQMPAIISPPPSAPVNNSSVPLLQIPPMCYPFMPTTHNSRNAHNMQLHVSASASPSQRSVNHTPNQQNKPQYYPNSNQNFQNSAYHSNSGYKNSGGNKSEMKLPNRQGYNQSYNSQGSYPNKSGRYNNINNNKGGQQKFNNGYNSNYRSNYTSESKPDDTKVNDSGVTQM